MLLLSHFIFLLFVLPQFFVADGDGDQRALQQNDTNSRCSESREVGVRCEDGSGTESSKKFYFDQRRGVCQPFVYKGCEGNGNRFDSASDCRKECQGTMSAGESSKRTDWVLADRCNATHLIPDGRYIQCSGGKCPRGHQCNLAEGLCCPHKDFVCSLQDDSGTFADGVPDKPRFAWNADIKSCWRFSYFGAKGNYNNFPTFQDCLGFCKK